MPIERIILELIPVPIFFLIYYRYFSYKPVYLKHLEGFLSGIAYALVLVLVSPYLSENILNAGALSEGFIWAAFIEKAGAFVVLLIIQRSYRDFTVLEGAVTAMVFGLGFATVENMFFSSKFGESIIYIRVLFSVPLHMTTCGIMGYYLAIRKMCHTGIFRKTYYMKSFLLPLGLHGVYDAALLKGGYTAFIVSPLLIMIIILFEIMLARSQTMMPMDLQRAMNIRFEDWKIIDQQPRYERWIYQSMGRKGTVPVHFFLWRPGFIRFLLVIGLFVFAISGLAFRNEIMHFLSLGLRDEEAILFLGVFPASVSFIMIMVGAVNPLFFKKSEIRIPIISDVNVNEDSQDEEIMITYDISSANCFLRTSEPLGTGTVIRVRFECTGFSSDETDAVVIWENHQDIQDARGTVIKFSNPSLKFYFFVFRYYIFRFRKGIVFNLKLPGFESTRKFFMRPITTMQKEVVLSAGTELFRQGESGNTFYLLKKGRVEFYKELESGEKITMDEMDAGQIFGEMIIVRENKRSVTAVCKTECIVAVADRDNLDALILNNVDFARMLIEKLAERMNQSENVLVDTIHSLDRQKMDNERYFHTAILLAMIGLGYSFESGSSMTVDFNRIKEIVRNMDDAVAEELINIVMLKQKMEDEEARKFISESINRLYESLNRKE